LWFRATNKIESQRSQYLFHQFKSQTSLINSTLTKFKMFIISWFFLISLILLSWNLSDDPNRVEGFWSILVLVVGAPIFTLLWTGEALITAMA